MIIVCRHVCAGPQLLFDQNWDSDVGWDRSMHGRGGKWADHFQLLYSLSPAVELLHSIVPPYLYSTHCVLSDIALRAGRAGTTCTSSEQGSFFLLLPFVLTFILCGWVFKFKY